jgi:hypothetical protein
MAQAAAHAAVDADAVPLHVHFPPGDPPHQQHQQQQHAPPAAPLPGYLHQAPSHGDICRFLSALYGTDRNRFVEMVKTDMTNMASHLDNPNGQTLVAHALGVATGPCAFLAVTPSGFGGAPTVEVLHCLRQYILPSSQPNAAQNPLQNRTLAFGGDMAHGQLPRILQEPAMGMPASFQAQPQSVPTEEAIATFYDNNADDQLVPNRNVATAQKSVASVAYIPQVWMPAFVVGLTPKRALDRAKELQQLMLVAEQDQFDYVLTFLRFACQKGGGVAQREQSKALLLCSDPGRSPELHSWALQQLRSYYPTVAVGGQAATPGNQPLPGVDLTAFGESLARGLSTGLTATFSTAAQGIQAFLPVQSTRTREDWTPLQRKTILKVMGKHASTDFDQEAPPIWAEFVSEGKSAEDIQRVIQDKFRRDPNDPDADDVTPFISRQTAKDIKACCFVPSSMTLETSIRGLLPLAMVPRTETEQYDETLDEEDDDRATLVTADQLRQRRAKSTRKAKAPKDYYELTDALKATVMLWTLLFRSDCGLVRQINQLRAILKTNKEALRESMSARHVAWLMWKVCMATQAFVAAPYSYDGEAPTPALHFVIAEARNCVFTQPINMPREFVAGDDALAPRPSYPQNSSNAEASFGEGTSGTAQRYHSVPQEVRDLLKEIKNVDDQATIQGVIRGSNVKAMDIVLIPGQCLEFTAMGVCRKKSCTFRHEQTARVEPDRIKNFVAKVKPLVDAFVDKRPRKRARG